MLLPSVLPPPSQSLVHGDEGDSRARFALRQEILGNQAGALSIEHRDEVGDAKLIAQPRQAKGFLAGLGRHAQQILASLLALEIDQGVFGFLPIPSVLRGTLRRSCSRTSSPARAASWTVHTVPTMMPLTRIPSTA